MCVVQQTRDGAGSTAGKKASAIADDLRMSRGPSFPIVGAATKFSGAGVQIDEHLVEELPCFRVNVKLPKERQPRRPFRWLARKLDP